MLTVTVAIPGDFALTIPAVLTVAIFVFEEVYSLVQAALELLTALSKSNFSPIFSEREVLLSTIEVGAFFTVTVHLALLPLYILQLMTAVPTFLVVIIPDELTVATDVFDDEYVLAQAALELFTVLSKS